jgi:tRNA dimethylallyltransferase
MIDVADPRDDFTVSIYKNQAADIIKEIFNRGKIPIIAGGTGFYIKTLLEGLDMPEVSPDEKFRTEMDELAARHGRKFLHDKLREIDPITAEKLYTNDKFRVIRALEVYHTLGKPMSEAQKNSTDFSTDYEISMIGLNMDRQLLYDRENSRVDEMLKNGLVDEVKMLLDMGYKRSLTSMQGLGYKEIASYIYGEYTFEEAIYKLKQNTRHFAKRQLTWFRREERINWIDVNSFNNREDLVKNIRCQIAGILNKI